jgi:hypothetical protein
MTRAASPVKAEFDFGFAKRLHVPEFRGVLSLFAAVPGSVIIQRLLMHHEPVRTDVVIIWRHDVDLFPIGCFVNGAEMAKCGISEADKRADAQERLERHLDAPGYEPRGQVLLLVVRVDAESIELQHLAGREPHGRGHLRSDRRRKLAHPDQDVAQISAVHGLGRPSEPGVVERLQKLHAAGVVRTFFHHFRV